MRFSVMSLLLLGLLLAGVAAAGAPPDSPSVRTAGFSDKQYLIGPGDQLGIEVWKDPTLTRTVVVLADGMITIPLVGEVQAGGRTVAELKKEIEERLSAFIPNPVLTLEVKQCNSLYVFVMGRVNNPCRCSVASAVNVLQALAMAGGLTPFAKRSQIRIFRNEGGRTRILPFDYDEVTAGNRLEENIELTRGDVVFVP